MIPHPFTGKSIHLEDMDDAQVAQLLIDLRNIKDNLQNYESALRSHIEERVEENDNDFGGAGIAVSYVRFKKYEIKDEEILNEIEVQNKIARDLKKVAKDLFDKHKQDVGTEKVQLVIKYPKL